MIENFKQCRRGQIIDVGDRILAYNPKERVNLIKIAPNGMDLVLTELGYVESHEVVKVTHDFVFLDNLTRFPRVYNRGVYEICGYKNRNRDITYRAFSLK